MKVHEMMTTDVCVVSPNNTLRDAAMLMEKMDIGSLPVGMNDRLVGIITDRDIAIRAVAQGKSPDTTVHETATEHAPAATSPTVQGVLPADRPRR